MVEAMDKWRSILKLSEVDVWTAIEQCIILAHTDYFEQLRLRRDGYAELLFAPPIRKGCDGGAVREGSADKSNASSRAVISEPQHVKEEDKDEDEAAGGEARGGDAAVVLVESDSEDDEAPVDLLHHDLLDDDVEALTDDIERERLLMKEIVSIKSTFDRVPTGSFLSEEESMDILYRIQELNISVIALKETEIGRPVSRYGRKHPSKVVRDKAMEMVIAWKVLVDEYCEENLASPTSENDGAEAGGEEEEVGLPSPPLDERDLEASRKFENISEMFNFSESDLSGASGPSPASDAPSVHRSGRKSSSSPEQVAREAKGVAPVHGSGRKSSSSPELAAAREGKGVARVIKVDKHRPVQTERTPDQTQRNATNASGSIRKVSNVPSGAGSTSGMNGAAVSRMHAGPSAPQRQLQSTAGGVRRSDARSTPSVGCIRPRVETSKPGLATRSEPSSSDVNERMEASKRKLHANYKMIENAKKQRTVQPLELTDLPKGGPKAQRPGQQRGWVKAK